MLALLHFICIFFAKFGFLHIDQARWPIQAEVQAEFLDGHVHTIEDYAGGRLIEEWIANVARLVIQVLSEVHPLKLVLVEVEDENCSIYFGNESLSKVLLVEELLILPVLLVLLLCLFLLLVFVLLVLDLAFSIILVFLLFLL